ncbi:tRNA pseudouridine(38-40) synthase TruA [Thermodesulfovibrionales bacterium]|nr:tRNA pseudouridine(38-40) synthase TruA [Thermodesulfovibrionales bacterium]
MSSKRLTAYCSLLTNSCSRLAAHGLNYSVIYFNNLMRNIKLTIQYDGTDYSGWQIQPNAVTIQALLQETIKKITDEDTKVIGAGRTDAGAHAIAQVASFRTSSRLSPEIIKRALNANLPHDVRITDANDVENDFHPRYDAKSKIYFYIISTSRYISPFLYRYAWRISFKLNADEMGLAIEFLKGRHDFSAFRASGCDAKTETRTIFNISVERVDAINFMNIGLNGSFLKICIKADAFLRYMARNIVGTLVEVGSGRIRPIEIQRILSSGDRRIAGPTAPAKGLFLERANY